MIKINLRNLKNKYEEIKKYEEGREKYDDFEIIEKYENSKILNDIKENIKCKDCNDNYINLPNIHLKYYYYNQSLSLRNNNILDLIKEIDESFVYNMNFYEL